MKKISHPLTIVLVGATGDLAKKKILKALYYLFDKDLLPDDFLLIGNARARYTDETFRQYVCDIVNPSDTTRCGRFCKSIRYISGSVDTEQTFIDIKSLLTTLKRDGDLLWYVATLPTLYEDVICHIGNCNLNTQSAGWVKFMLEKPFGTDLLSAQTLNEHILKIFTEDQIYRIDHVLAKETTQNLLAFRFANGLFEHLWSSDFIDHVQVNYLEDFGVEGREVFYDATGTVRDVIQNHVLQMIAMTLMDKPVSLSESAIRSSRKNILQSFSPIDLDHIQDVARFGQYVGYLDHPHIPTGSRTETAVALKMGLDHPRWRGVPIYIRTGKKLGATVNEITIQFKQPAGTLYWDTVTAHRPSAITLRIGPNEGVIIRLWVKKPGLDLRLEEVPMQFCYKNEFQMNLVEAYVKLIYDAVNGDPTLFPHASGIEASWRYIQPLLDYKASSIFRPEQYEVGSWGPTSFEELLEIDGRTWLTPSPDVCAISNVVRQR